MAKARTPHMTKIDTALFTDRMIMQLENSLNRYEYLRARYDDYRSKKTPLDAEFYEEYYDFYAMSASPDFKGDKGEIVKGIYFDLLKNTENKNKSPKSIAQELQTKAKDKGIDICNHLSFSTKLIHTINNDEPIYDSRICEYLSKIYKVRKTMKGIKDWYDSKDPKIKKDQNDMLDWLGQHPILNKFSKKSGAKISETKIIDSMIYIWHKYK